MKTRKTYYSNSCYSSLSHCDFKKCFSSEPFHSRRVSPVDTSILRGECQEPTQRDQVEEDGVAKDERIRLRNEIQPRMVSCSGCARYYYLLLSVLLHLPDSIESSRPCLWRSWTLNPTPLLPANSTIFTQVRLGEHDAVGGQTTSRSYPAEPCG